jgi:hypothetical protein
MVPNAVDVALLPQSASAREEVLPENWRTPARRVTMAEMHEVSAVGR